MVRKIWRCTVLIFVLSQLSTSFAANKEVAINKFLSKVKNFVQLKMEEDETPGVVVLLNSPVLGRQAFALGYAALPPQPDKMTVDKKFRVASISKTFMSVLILKLVQQGKIGLDDKMVKYLPKNLDKDLIPNVQQITIRQLLNMTSGIPEYYDLDVDEYLARFPYKVWSPQDTLKFAADLKPKFTPGSGYEYSNTNYALLQMILRQVTGKELSVNLQEMICEPLGLNNTFADDFKLSAYTLDTKGYDTKRDAIDMSEKDDGFGIGDTFVVTNAFDLNKFVQALLLNKTLLSESSLKAMLMPSAYGRYGLGIEVSHVDRWGYIYSHNGLVNGYQTNYFYLPQSKLTVIILTNNRATTLIEPVLVRLLYYYSDFLKSFHS